MTFLADVRKLSAGSVSTANEPVIVVSDIDQDQDIALKDAILLLSPTELACAKSFVSCRDQARYIRCRGFLRVMLGAMMDRSPDSLRIAAGYNGKPQLMAEAWARPEFNVSHSGGVAVIAVSWTGPVGVDVERRDRALNPLLLAGTVLLPAETAALADLSPEDTSDLFLRFWTAKEARMKLTGEGMSLDPRQIALRLHENQPVGFDLPASPKVALQYPDLGRLDLICALATLEQTC